MSVTGTWIADRRIFLNAKGEAVEDKDPTAVELLVPIGGSLPMARAHALGLVTPSEKAGVTEATNIERMVEALTAKDEEIRKLISEVEAYRKAVPTDEDKAKATHEAEEVLRLKDEEIKKLGDRVTELETEVAELKKSGSKAVDHTDDKAVKPAADKSVKPGSDK